MEQAHNHSSELEKLTSVEDLVGVFLVTYNRSRYLERTLRQILSEKSPFRLCEITVLNNASTDGTMDVVEHYRKKYSNLHLFSHPLNIGASPNYLRAIEISKKPYTWILGDDDLFDFSEVEDFRDMLGTGHYDLISIGSPGQRVWERGLCTTTQELARQGSRYFFTFSFITGTIFRTALFTSECVYEGYKNCANLYPHFPFLAKCIENNCSVYITVSPMIVRDLADDSHHMPFLIWLLGWSLSFIIWVSPRWRKKMVFETLGKPWPDYLDDVVLAVVEYKANHHHVPWHQLGAIAFSGWPLTLLWFPALLVALLPTPAHKMIHRYLYRRSTSQATDKFRL